jgi:hypothetical protein
MLPALAPSFLRKSTAASVAKGIAAAETLIPPVSSIRCCFTLLVAKSAIITPFKKNPIVTNLF